MTMATWNNTFHARPRRFYTASFIIEKEPEIGDHSATNKGDSVGNKIKKVGGSFGNKSSKNVKPNM